MGVKHVNKCPNGKVDSMLMAQHISEPNRKCATNNDPYGAEERGTFKAELPVSLPPSVATTQLEVS